MMGYFTRREILVSIMGFLSTLGLMLLSPKKWAQARFQKRNIGSKEVHMKLREPDIKGEMPLETTIKRRRTIRSFRSETITIDQISQLLWAAQGITADKGYFRAAPSGGALYPMDVYSVVGAGSVSGMDNGVYHYSSRDHSLSLVKTGDMRVRLARAALSQMWMAKAPLNFIITAEYDRIRIKYGIRGIRYAMIEAGHIGQNIFLQSEALGLSAGIVGAFHDNDVIKVAGIPVSHEPLLIMPVGRKR